MSDTIFSNNINASIFGSIFDEAMPFGKMKSPDGQKIALQSIAITGDINGLLFSFSIRQEYKNETSDNLEIIYTFPLAWNTALLDMQANIGGRELKGHVVEKTEAEENYEKAIEDGDSAIMIQKSGEGLYTANLGNIKAGETVTLQIHCAKFLSVEQGRVRLAIPTVIGERYGDAYQEGGLARHESAKVDVNAHYEFSLELNLHGDITNKKIFCPNHEIIFQMRENGANITLNKNAVLDRDFVLLIEGMDNYADAIYIKDADEYMIAASFAPSLPQKEISPIALKILIDCSGSMQGESIRQAQKGLHKIISLLTARDYISYSRFGTRVEHMSVKLLSCDEQTLENLNARLASTKADMGGTEMGAALQSTFAIKNANDNLTPAILMITDGDVWDIKNIMDMVKSSGHRIYIIGVGSAPAESLLEEMGAQSGGACEFVTPNEDMAEAIVRMFQKMRGATADKIEFDWGERTIWQSATPKSIYDGETVHAFALLKSKPQTRPLLKWEVEGQAYSSQAESLEASGNTDLLRIGRLWQMNEIASDKEKLDIALKYQLVSDLTSIILVYERDDKDKVKGLPKIQQVPQMPAHGHGSFLGAASACFGNFASSGTRMLFDVMPDSFMPQEPYKPRSARPEDLKAFVDWWQGNFQQWTSVGDFIRDVENMFIFEPIVELVHKFAKGLKISDEAVWGAFIPWAIQKVNNGQDIERHAQRLLKLFQIKDREKVIENCEAWYKQSSSSWLWDILKRPPIIWT